MAGYQFAHVGTYSQKGNKKNLSSTDVLLENSRVPGNHSHVENPKPPNLIYGDDPADAIKLIEQRFQLSKAHLRGSPERIQINTHVLQGSVFSNPTPVAQLEIADEATRQSYLKWRKLSCEFAINEADEMGMEVVSIVEHLDEEYPHIHVLSVPKVDADNPRMDVKRRHVGHIAQQLVYDATLKENLRNGIDEDTARKSAGNAGQRAFKKRMSEWQDNYYEKVASKCGLARLGPNRGRLSREQWKRTQQQAEQLVKLDDKLNLTKSELSQYQESLERIEGLFDDNDKLKGDVKQLTAANENLQNDNEALKRALSDLNAKHDADLKAMRERANTEITRLQNELDQHAPRLKR